MKPEQVYDTIVNLDRRVRIRHVAKHKPVNSNPPAGSLPTEYLRWAESASDDDVDVFWYYISEGLWRDAKRISQLPTSIIADIMANFHSGPPSIHGTPSVEAYVFNGLPLHRFLYFIRLAPDQYRKYYDRYINNRHAPPYEALPKRAKEAFEYLAKELEVVMQ